MSEEEAHEVVLAVRIAPAHFLVEAGQMKLGDRFTVDGAVYELVGAPTLVSYLTVLTKVREIEGPGAGREFTARLQGGERQA